MVKGGQIGLYLRSIYMDLGIPMKVEIQRDCSTANYLTDRLGRGPRTKHTDTRYLGARTRSRWRSQYQEGAYSEKRADVGTKPICASVPQQHCKFAGLISTDLGSHTPLQDVPKSAQLLNRADVGGAIQTIVRICCEHRDGCNGP